MDAVVGFINDVAQNIFNVIMFLLPDSPFRDLTVPPFIADILGYVNYYLPFGTMVTIGFAWCSCILVYYGYQLVLRYIRAIR